MNGLDSYYSLLIRGSDLTESEREHLCNLYQEQGREELYRMAKAKKILPFVANAFACCGLDVTFWQEIMEQYRIRNRAILNCLDKAYAELTRQGVTNMFVTENFGALLSSGNDIGLFASGDVDNHADPEEKEKIYRAFENLGYTRKERFFGGHQIAAEFFPPETEGLPEKFYISVDFYPLARLKLPCFVRSDEFVDWDKLFCYENTAIRLPPADALMYICLLHISLHSFSRAPDIRLYIDLLNMFRTKVDYEKIASWCRRDHTCTRAAVAATISNALTGTRFPDAITHLSDKKQKVLALVYDAEKSTLRYEPHGLKVLQIEIRCNDSGILSGVKELLFPDRAWMKKVYGGSGIAAHLKHFIKVL